MVYKGTGYTLVADNPFPTPIPPMIIEAFAAPNMFPNHAYDIQFNFASECQFVQAVFYMNDANSTPANVIGFGVGAEPMYPVYTPLQHGTQCSYTPAKWPESGDVGIGINTADFNGGKVQIQLFLDANGGMEFFIVNSVTKNVVWQWPSTGTPDAMVGAPKGLNIEAVGVGSLGGVTFGAASKFSTIYSATATTYNGQTFNPYAIKLATGESANWTLSNGNIITYQSGTGESSNLGCSVPTEVYNTPYIWRVDAAPV